MFYKHLLSQKLKWCMYIKWIVCHDWAWIYRKLKKISLCYFSVLILSAYQLYTQDTRESSHMVQPNIDPGPWRDQTWCCQVKVGAITWVSLTPYSQSKSSAHDKLHELHSHFPPIAQRTPSIIISSCWKSTFSDIRPSCSNRKRGVFRMSQFRLPS